jgi:hypothetical protein
LRSALETARRSCTDCFIFRPSSKENGGEH